MEARIAAAYGVKALGGILMTPATSVTHAAAPTQAAALPRATNDEILGIAAPSASATQELDPLFTGFEADDSGNTSTTRRRAQASVPAPGNVGTKHSADDAVEANLTDAAGVAEPANLREAFDANPELRTAWNDANEYREAFATPEEARHARALLGELNRMDALFFSRRPEDHAALARAIADLDPASFQSLTRAINEYSKQTPDRREAQTERPSEAEREKGTPAHRGELTEHDSRTANHEAQAEFLTATNASAVESVLSVIESQVERVLPEGISKSARTRVVGEIYRELDSTLRSNHQLAAQMRDAFRSGSLDAEHQRAIVSLIAGRARQALPGVAKRVLNEWTSTLVSANRQRLSRQRTAERRVDIAGSTSGGNDGRRSTSPRDLDYSRLSDADILNL
ncbi:MAG: hypothetical protein WB987_03430 [Candidatus Acidiferrales bacterium]